MRPELHISNNMKKRPFLAFVLFVSLVMTLLVTGCHKAQLDADSCYIYFDQASKAAASKKKDILILTTYKEVRYGTYQS